MNHYRAVAIYQQLSFGDRFLYLIFFFFEITIGAEEQVYELLNGHLRKSIDKLVFKVCLQGEYLTTV